MKDTDLEKQALDEAVAAFVKEGRPDSVLTGYALVYVATDYSEIGTGTARYNETSLSGQQHHVTEGLLKVGAHLLEQQWLRGGVE